MTLEGAKFICLDEAGNHGKVVLAKGRKFTMGYYVSCDFVLVDERAKGVHCEIECDAFGRVTIRNLSPDRPILVNGCSVEIKRILLNNSKLLILDKEYLWQFSKCSINEFEDIPIETESTPLKQIGFPEQPPNSCPDFKLHRDIPKRFTVHNFAYCIQSDEEGNTSAESNDGNTNSDSEENQIEVKNGSEIETKDSNGNTSETIDLDKAKGEKNRSITPDPNKELAISHSELLETPKVNIIDCSNDKENKSAQKKMNDLLKMCHQSDLVITSFSPRETGVKIEKSFATIIKPKMLVAKTPLTPKSVYSTPKSDMNEIDDENEKDLMTFHTPSTSKKGMRSTSATKILKNSSMHLIDLTTPAKLRPETSYFKPALKVSGKKTIAKTIDKSHIKLPSDEHLGISSLPATSVVTSEISSSKLGTPSSVVNVSSSMDISSVIEISDGSNASVSNANASGPNTPLKPHSRIDACTPKKTPHSLMKRAILTSVKKQNTTPQLNTQNTATPHRDLQNRKVIRGNIGLSGTLVTPQASAGNLSNKKLYRRQSMSTPSRKNVLAKIRFDNASSTTNICSDSPTTSRISRRSSLNPISAARYLSTSTPMSGSRTNAALRNLTTSKTSSLHKVLKSSGGVPLSSHISKACRSIALPGSTSKITSIKKISPQQVMSDRLVSRARNILCGTPISAISRKTAASVKIPAQLHVPSIKIQQEETTQSAKKPGQKDQFLTNKQSVDDSQENLSRTFIINSDDEENVDNRSQQQIPKDATFSPKKDLNEIEVNSTVKGQQPIEIPVDVEEVANTTKENKRYECEDKKQKVVESKNTIENKDTNSTTPVVDTIKATVTEESFAEVINDLNEQSNLANLKNTIEKVVVEENREREGVLKTPNKEEANVVDTGFGEESFVETFNNKNVHSDDKSENRSLSNENDSQNTKTTSSKSSQDSIMEAVVTNTILKEKGGETKFSDAQRVDLVNTDNEQKSCEYKPIVEDITLEGSLIETEAKEFVITKQRVTSLESSLIEEKVKDEKIKAEDTEILEESTDKEQLSTSIKVFEMSELFEKERCFEDNMDHERNIPQAKESSSNIQEKETTLTEIENVETDDNNRLDLKSFVSKEVDETNKFSETTEKPHHTSQTEQSDKCSVYADTFKTNVEETYELLKAEDTQVFKPAEQSTTYQFNANDTVDNFVEEITETSSKSPSSTAGKNRIDGDIEDTNKLLEEIEDVLNKSDEIKQKHLNELEECSDKPLSEEFETEQLSEEVVTEVEDKNKLLTLNYEKTDEISTHINKPTSQKDKNEEEKTEENIKKVDETCGEEESEAEKRKAQTLIRNEEDSECFAFQLRDNTKADNEDANSEVKNYNSESIEEDITTNKEILDINCQEISKKIETENDISNEQTIEKMEENIVCESDQEDSSWNNNNKINAEIENPVIEFVQKDQNIAAKYTSNIPEDMVTESELRDTEKESYTTNKLAIDKNLQVEENITEIENRGHKIIQKKMENVASFTPRRSIRRASQSTDTPEPTAELTFTPRRSARRGSMSTESPIPCTPTRRTTRRSSLSVDNESPLTPKPITKRRVSISLDSETYKPSTSKIQRAKTPRKLLEQSMVIPEEIDEFANDGEVQTAPQKIQFDEKKYSFILDDDATAKSSFNMTPRSKTPRKQLEQSPIIPEEVDEDVVVILSEESEPESKVINMKDLQEKEKATEPAKCLVKEGDDKNVSQTQDLRKTNNSTLESKLEMPAKILEVSISSAETTVTQNKKSEETQLGIETETSKDNSNPRGDIVDFVNVQGNNNDAAGKAETPETKKCNETVGKQYQAAKELKKESSGALNIAETSTEHNIKAFTNELAENSGNAEQKEISSPDRSAKFSDDNPKTPVMLGVRELLKTPKADACTSRLGGIRDLVRTPKKLLETEHEEFERLGVIAELVRTPGTHITEISTSTCKQEEKNLADATKTPSMLKTPKRAAETTQLGGISNLALIAKESSENEDEIAVFAVAANISDISSPKLQKCDTASPKTPFMKEERDENRRTMDENYTTQLSANDLLQSPKSALENDQEEIEKLSVLSTLIKTEEDTKDGQNIVQEKLSHSMKTDKLEGVKELLKTPKSCATPRFRGIRELMQTPKISSTPKTKGIKELLETPTPQEADDIPTSTLISKQNLEELKGIKEMLKAPMSYSTPRMKGIKELMQTPKISSTPLLTGIKELMETPAAHEDQELEKFLRTPAAKNIMIPALPSSAVIEKSGDSIEVSTEYDLNATNEDDGTNLEELFKTPMSSRFVERITGSYYDQEMETDERCDSRQNESLQDTINKGAEEAFDKLIGQDTQVLTPIRKVYPRKSFAMQTPQCQSPFTAADVLSDLPKTDVEEWIETLDQAEQPVISDCDDIEGNQDSILVENDIISESLNQAEEASCSMKYSLKVEDDEDISFNESVIPETCTKVYLTENNFKRKNKASISYTETKDPLLNTTERLNENETNSLLTTEDAEISGINLLDQTFESLQDEPSMFDEHLVVEEASMFEEALIVSDNESDVDNTLTGADNPDISQDGGNGLSEPLLVSDGEEHESNSIFEADNILEITQAKDDDVLQISGFEIDSQEKSMLEKASSKIHSMAEDPLETEVTTKDKTLIDIDVSQCIVTSDKEDERYDNEPPLKSEDSLALSDCLLQDIFSNENEEIMVSENSKANNFEAKVVLNIPSTSCKHSLTIENVVEKINVAGTDMEQKLCAKEIAIKKTRLICDDSEDIFVDSTVTDICEETGNGLNEKENRMKYNKRPSGECQDIFMDNSNIDENFADEALTKENVEPTSAALKNNPKDVYSSMGTGNNESETTISDGVYFNEIVEYNAESEIYVSEGLVEAKVSQTEINAKADKISEKTSTTVCQSPSVSQEVNRTTENIYELPELLLQGETLRKESNVIEVGSPEQNAEETNAVQIYETNTQNLYVEVDCSETLPTDAKPLLEDQIETQSNKTTELSQDTPTAKSNETIAILECEMSQDETYNTGAHEAATELIPSSTEFISSEIITEKPVPKPIKLDQQSAFEAKHDKSTPEDKINQSEIVERMENKHSEDIQNISDDKEISKNDTVECITTSSSKAQNLNDSDENVQHLKETEKDECEPAINPEEIPEFDIVAEGNEKVSSSSSEVQDLHGKVTKEVLRKEKVEVITEKAMSTPTNTQEALSKLDVAIMESSEDPDKVLILSSEVIKYDFEIEIVDADRRKETETDLKSPTNYDTTSVSDNITSHLEEDCDGKTIHVLQGEKVENVDKVSAVREKDTQGPKNYQKHAELPAEENEIKESKIIKPKVVREKGNMSESSQESTQEDEMSTRRNRRKIIKKTIEEDKNTLPDKLIEKVEENINDNREILKVRTPDEIKENEKSNSDSMTIFEHKQTISTETVTGSNKELVREVKRTSHKEFAQQNAETAEILNKEYIVLAKEIPVEENVEKDENQKQSASTSKQINVLSEEKNLTTVITLPKESIFDDSKNQKDFNVSEENIAEIAVANIKKLELQLPKGYPTNLIEQDSFEKDILGKSSTDDVTHTSSLLNTGQASQQEMKPEADKGNSSTIEDVVISPEKTKHQIAKRTRRKPCGFESNQESVLQDDKKSAKTSRRNMHRLPVEEVVVDRSKDNEGIAENFNAVKSSEINLESGKTSTEAKHIIEQIGSIGGEIVEVESGIIEDQQQTEKRIGRTETVAESNPNTVQIDDTSRSRKGRRRLPKTPVEEIVIEKETYEARTKQSKQDDNKNANELEEENREIEQNVNETEESKQNILKNVNEMKEVSNDDNSGNEMISDIGIAEVYKVELKETSSDVRHDPTSSKPEETSKHLELTEDNKIPKVNANDETTGRRGRNKRIVQEKVLEEPTVSRKGRRKGKILKTDISVDKMETAIKSQFEDSNANEAPIVSAATDEQLQAQKANETSCEEISKKVVEKDDLVSKNSESSTTYLNKSEKLNHQTAEEIGVINLQKPSTSDESKQILTASEIITEKDMHEVDQSAKKTTKRGRTIKNRAKINEANKQVELNIESAQKTENIQSNDERVEMQKDFVEKPQKSSKRRAAVVNRAQDDEHQEDLIKSRKRKAGHDENEIMIEPKKPTEDSLLSEVNITEASLEPELSLDQHTSLHDVKVRKGRKKTNYQDRDESGPSIKKRGGRKKQVEEKNETIVNIASGGENLQKDGTETITVNEKAQIESDIDNPEAEKETKEAEISEIPTRSRRNIGRRKPEYKEDNDQQITYDLDTGKSDDINKHIKEDIVSSSNKQLQDKTKKSRERKNKNHEKTETALPTPSHSPDSKHEDHISKEEIQNDEKSTKEPEANTNVPTANMETETPRRTAAVARKGRKAFVHITAESQEPDDTPGRRARNVPQRRAATAYHNYNETSDTEVSTKTKKKTDSPRKSLEGSKKSAAVPITAAPITVSPSTAPAALITTARGRTRKPTAKVQQFLEEERAKAETPKKRALLAAAAAAASANADVGTPQVTPARRGRKPSTIEIDGITPQASKSRGRGKYALLNKEEEPTPSTVPEIVTVVEEKEIELQKDTQPVLNTAKERRGGRKTKITDEDHDNSDEPPTKKSPSALRNETQVSTSSAETATTPPTRVAGRRNAAAAAKARIEEDALAAAAIDPPKRARTKKVTPKVSTPVVATANTDAHSSEVEQQQTEKLEKDGIKDKISSEKREHRLASASTIEGIEDLQDENETEAEEKTVNKRGHKALSSTTTDSPAVPAKRGRKPKLVEVVTDPETPLDSKTTRGRGRGRKNVHFDEHKSEATSSSQQNVTDIESTPVDTTAPVKRGTRTRRK